MRLWENVFLLLHMLRGLCTREYGRALPGLALHVMMCSSPGPHTHSNMLCGCVYKHCTDTQTQRVSKRGIDQWETSLPYGWERAEVTTLDANAPLAWSVPETQCTGGQQKRVTLLNSKEPDSRCVHPHAHACTFILVRTSYTPQMLTNHCNWILNPDLHSVTSQCKYWQWN